MSVLIKGMKMPDSCYHCKIAESCGHYIANYTNRRHPDCPLVALPDHHGRLVDADATIKEIKARNPYDVSYEDAWAITCIEHAPTIVEAEDENADHE